MDWTAEIDNIRFSLDLRGDSESLVTDQEIIDQLELYPADWRLAAASLADHLAVRAINRPTSFTATGKMSVMWADRAESWRKTARAFREAVAQDDANAATSGTISVAQLIRRDGIPEEPEYSRSRKPWNLG